HSGAVPSLGMARRLCVRWNPRNYLRVQESSLWLESAKSGSPLKDVVSGAHLKNLMQIVIMMLGFWFGAQSLISIMPGVLIQHLHVPSKLMTNGQGLCPK